MGPVIGALVLAEFGDDPRRYTDGKARRNYAATSPSPPSPPHPAPSKPLDNPNPWDAYTTPASTTPATTSAGAPLAAERPVWSSGLAVVPVACRLDVATVRVGPGGEGAERDEQRPA